MRPITTPPLERRQGAIAGAAIGGALGLAAGMVFDAARNAETVETFSARSGILAVDEEAVWVLEADENRALVGPWISDQDVESMLLAWEERRYTPFKTRIPIAQVARDITADGELVLKYHAQQWTIRLWGGTDCAQPTAKRLRSKN